MLGVDRFMSEARAITNLIGNAVATVVIAKSEGAFSSAARGTDRCRRSTPGPMPSEATDVPGIDRTDVRPTDAGATHAPHDETACAS